MSHRSLYSIIASVAIIFGFLACSRDKSEGPVTFDDYISLAEKALVKADTVTAVDYVYSASLLKLSEVQRFECTIYSATVGEHLSRKDVLKAISYYDTLSINSRRALLLKMRSAILQADILRKEGKENFADYYYRRASALAYEIGDHYTYAKLRYNYYTKLASTSRYVDAIEGLRQLLNYTAKHELKNIQLDILYCLNYVFYSLGDDVNAMNYLNEISNSISDNPHEQIRFLIAKARTLYAIGDISQLNSCIRKIRVLMQDVNISAQYLNSLLTIEADYYLAKNDAVKARASIDSLGTSFLSLPGASPAPDYATLQKARVSLLEGHLDSVKFILDKLDAKKLRQNNISLYEKYVDVASGYYDAQGDNFLAYTFLQEKGALLDSLKRETVGHNIAFQNMALMRDSTIVSQRHKINVLETEKQRVSRFRLIGLLGVVLLFFVCIIFYLVGSVRNIKRKNQELEKMRIRLAEEIKERKSLLAQQKALLDEKNEELRSELLFGYQVQNNILPSESMLTTPGIAEHFILFKPYNLISGDFYWFFDTGDKLFICEADATGHGVPGAFISMLASSLMSNIVIASKDITSHDLLEQLDTEIGVVLRNNTDIINSDSLDMSMLCYDRRSKTFTVCLSRQTAYIVKKNGELIRHKGCSRSVGDAYDFKSRQFLEVPLDLEPGDCIYLASDGYVSQFGGPDMRKIKQGGLEKWLLEVHDKPMDLQRAILSENYDEWKGDVEQTDDVLIIGLKV